MTRRTASRYRMSAIALWIIAIFWIAWDPTPAAHHRLVLAGAITTSVLAGVGRCLFDLRTATLLAVEAGRRQVELERAGVD